MEVGEESQRELTQNSSRTKLRLSRTVYGTEELTFVLSQ